MTVLGIETSCDETCAAVIEKGRLCSNIIASQDVHIGYGGVVPELASRMHMEHITTVVQKAFERSRCTPSQLGAIGVTYGPGLIGSLLVGLNFAKGLSLQLGVPLLGINHLDGHLFSNNLEPANGPQPPFITLIISGGHTILIHVRDWGQYELLGETQDDAAGEAFDKVARILGLPYPGGPQIENLAKLGRADAIKFPVAKLKDAPLDFSFSGLKTAVLYHVQKEHRDKGELPQQSKADIAAAFQYALITAIVETIARAYQQHPVTAVAIAGGVACNKSIRAAMTELGKALEFSLFYPKPVYCTDNAAMIARAAYFYMTADSRRSRVAPPTGLAITPDPGLKLPSIL